MTLENLAEDEVIAIRKAIESFIDEKLKKKEESNDTDFNQDECIHTENKYHDWIASAAKRAYQRQIVTHGLKFLNPNAKGSCFHVTGNTASDSGFVCTLTIPEQARKFDVIGNGGASDVDNFLISVVVENESLLSRVIRRDPSLKEALPGTSEERDEWISSFSKMTVDHEKRFYSHSFGKQIYFPVEGGYHLLAPLFPSVLVQEIYERVQFTKFSEEAKQLRKARTEHRFVPGDHQEFIHLAIVTFGGSKPQNISKLNSGRGGIAYLLPSIPPHWKSNGIRLPLNTPTVFSKYHFPHRVRGLIDQLKKLLLKTSYNNSAIRQGREDLVRKICDELIIYANELQQSPTGWTKNIRCKLNFAETCWFDPFRFVDEPSEKEGDFDWKEMVCHNFGLWLNKELQTDELRFGDDEYTAWRKVIDKELDLIKEII